MPAVLVAAALALALAPTTAHATPRWNFVVILADDLGWMDLGIQGSTFYETPHLDALAARGMRFDAFYAASPLCSPTRASLMTGQAPARLRLTKAVLAKGEPPGPGTTAPPGRRTVSPVPRDRLPEETVTLPERLREAGWTTAHIGKWHLGPRGSEPTRHGFETNVAGDAYPTPPPYFAPYWIDFLPEGPDGEYLTDRLTDEAVRFIASHADEPFFLYLSHFAVHGPFQAKPELVARYREKADADAPQHNAIYAAMIQSLDESVGRVVAALETHGVAERTVVIFLSDNGAVEAIPPRKGHPRMDGLEPGTVITSNAPLRGGKGSLYEGGIRVPAVVLWPGVTPRASRSATPLITMDLYPTVLEIAGLAQREGAVLDGESFASLLRGEAPTDRDALYFHFPHLGARAASAIRKGPHKLIHFYEGDDELYDLATDPGEAHDLARIRPELAAALRGQLDAWLREVDAQLPTPNPNYRGAHRGDEPAEEGDDEADD